MEEVEEITTEVSKFGQLVQESLPAIASFGIRVVLAIVVFWIGSRLINWAIRTMKKSLDKTTIGKGVISFLGSFAKIVLYVMLVYNIASYFGVTESSMAALLASAGVTVGLALQGGLSNLAGGVMLLLFKPFQVGDYIVVNDTNACEGSVSKIEICYTTLTTIDNRQIVIPNGTLSDVIVTNVTGQKERKLEIKLGVSYTSDIKKVKTILERVLREDPDVMSDRDMKVYMDSMADSSIIMGILAWVPTSKYLDIKWRVNERIKEEFDAEGIQIPYNQLDVHLHQ